MSLYNKYEQMEPDFSQEISGAIEPIIQKYKGKGFSLHSIHSAISMTVVGVMAEEMLRYGVEERKHERLEKKTS